VHDAGAAPVAIAVAAAVATLAREELDELAELIDMALDERARTLGGDGTGRTLP
tara:strand:- start:1229 stop:1390 length:162 start_codon:yes stop_codon:yes gene_type:complete